MDAEVSFGQRIKDSRMAIGLTQAELARRVGCATITIRKIEADTLRPSVQIGERLAMALDVPLEARADFIRQARAATPDTPEPPTPTPPPAAEEIGREDLSGRAVRGYQLAERIGEGGFGAVYRATHPSLPREVAVKIILPKFANDPDLIRRFEAEAELVARLEHPFIIRLYDYWREPNTACLVMQLMRGGSLKDLLEGGPLPLARALPLFEQICQALRAAHRFGVIHRDLKPANVLLDEEENAYLADFGIAKNLGDPDMVDHTHTGALIGSFAYVSPEQIRSESILPQADIYSLGVLLFQLLTGVLPFKGPTPIDYIQQHLNAPLPSCLDEVPGLPPGVDAVIQRATAKQVADRYPDVLAMLADFRNALSAGAPADFRADFAEIDPAEIENPFKGLRPFGEADAGDFFGRDALVQELLGRLGEEGDLARFQAVIGPSGSGKSSVVKAGLIPALRRGGLPGSEKWFVVDFLPGSHPFEELEAALLRVAVNPPDSLLEQLQSGERGLLRAVRRVLPADEAVELVLVIDQFEELFTLVGDDAVRRAFLDSLVATVMDPRGRTRIVVTLRADFVDRPLAFVDFGELMRERTTFILPLAPDELEEAVEAPARRAGLVPEPGLSARIVRELGDQPGTLPLLQHTLSELFERRDGRRLTLAAYREIGGVLGSLGRTADDVYAKLGEAGQRLARQLFLRLVTLGEGVEDTRRRVLQAELESLLMEDRGPGAGGPKRGAEAGENGRRSPVYGPPSPLFRQVLDSFGRARLLTFDRDPVTRGPTVEVAHEALLREWPRLKSWLQESRADVRLQRVLGQAAAEWVAADRDAGYLFREARLDQFEAWAQTTDLALTAEERAFLEECLAARREREAEEAQRAAREQQLEERSRNFLRALVFVFAVAAVVAGALSVFAFNQQGIAEEQRGIAEVERMTALIQASIGLASQARLELDGNFPERAPLLALEAVEHYPYTWQAERALGQAVFGHLLLGSLRHAADVNSAQFSPDDSRILTASVDGSSKIWDAFTGELLVEFAVGGDVRFAKWDPNGQRILTTSRSPATQIWNAQTGELLFTFAGQDSAADFSPTGDRIITTGNADGPFARIWDADTGTELYTLEHREWVSTCSIFTWCTSGSTVWSPDGSRVVTRGGGGIIVWNALNGQEINRLGDETIPYYSVYWSPTDDRILTTNEIGEIEIWDAGTGERLVSFTGHTHILVDALWSPDADRVLTFSWDNTARVWDASTGDELIVFDDHDQVVWVGAWSADGNHILTAGGDGKAILWDSRTGAWSQTFHGHSSDILSVDWNSTEDRVLTSATDGTAKIWSIRSVPLLFEIPGEEGSGAAEAYSNDGRMIARDRDSFIQIFDAFSGELLQELSGHTGAGPQLLDIVEFSPEDDMLLSTGWDGYVRVWNLATGEELNAFEVGGRPTADWSPDGSMIVVSNFDDITPYQYYIFDVGTGEELRRFEHPPGNAFVSWSPDGTKIALGSYGDWAQIQDASTGEVIYSLYPPEFNLDVSVPYWSPDGSLLATFSADGLIWIWDTSTGEAIQTMGGHNAFVFRMSWFPSGERLLSSDSNNATKIWDIETGNELFSLEIPNSIGARLSPDGTRFFVNVWPDGPIKVYSIWGSLEELIGIARECCLIRDLTPEEREQFGLPPLEGPESPGGSGAAPGALPFALLASTFLLAAAAGSNLRAKGRRRPSGREEGP